MPRASGPGVCVAGMHRAGTSMVARLLNLCGLWLGPPEELVPPAPDNAEGFWENLHLVGVNDLVLGRLGGTWDVPPALPAGWEHDARLDDLVLAATELVGRLADVGPWAWKDPRNSLTLPFWERVVPGAPVVLCLRSPLEVARSLAQRDGMSLAETFELWATYYTHALEHAAPARLIVTDYARYFADAGAEVRRVLAFLDLHPSHPTIEAALAAVAPHLRHQRAAPPDLAAAGAPPRVVRLDALLRSAASRSPVGADALRAVV